MGSRVIYFCDWCNVDAPKSDEIPGCWAAETQPGTGLRMHLCYECKDARAKAIKDCAAQRQSPAKGDR